MANRRQRTPVILVFQGGGALGAYECGVYQVLGPYLKEQLDEPLEVVAGTSIGAVNAAFVAAHYTGAEDGGARDLERFWTEVLASATVPFVPGLDAKTRAWNAVNTSLLFGNRHIFSPLVPAWYWFPPISWSSFTHFYSPQALRQTVRQALTQAGEGWLGAYPKGAVPRLIVTAVELETTKPVPFHNGVKDITPEHILASCSLPPSFPATIVEGRHYWDGGLWSNTPLPDVLNVLQKCPLERPQKDADNSYKAYIIDTFPQQIVDPENPIPLTNWEVGRRINEIAYQDKTRYDDKACEWVNCCIELYGLLEELSATEGLDASLKGRIEQTKRQWEKMKIEQRIYLDVVRIGRLSCPFEQISGDVDFSPDRIKALICQGKRDARAVLEVRPRQGGSRGEQASHRGSHSEST
jgi:NTE family protein